MLFVVKWIILHLCYIGQAMSTSNLQIYWTDLLPHILAPLYSGYHDRRTSFKWAWTQVLLRFKPYWMHVGDPWLWGSLTMVPVGNKAKHLSLVNHSIKTIHYYNHRHHHHHDLFSLCLNSAKISTSNQRCFNVVNQHWNNVVPTLNIKQYPTSIFQRCHTLIQRRVPTLKQRRENVAQR